MVNIGITATTGLGCTLVHSVFYVFFIVALFSPNISGTVDHNVECPMTLWGGGGVWACSRGIHCLPPPRDKKNTSLSLPKTVNQPNIPSCLLPPALYSLVTSHIWTQLFFFLLGNKKERQQWTEGEKLRHISKCYGRSPQKPPSSHNCPPTFKIWKNKQQGLPWPKHLCGFYCKKNKREGTERKKSSAFISWQGHKDLLCSESYWGVWTKTWNSLVGVCGHIIKKRNCQSCVASSGSRRRCLVCHL